MTSHRRNTPVVMPDTLAECELLMDQISADCTTVRGQVDAAKAAQKATGRYADPQWFHRASTALRWMNRDRQRLQDHMAALRRAARAAQPEQQDALLIAALRAQGGEEVFLACAERVRAQAGCPE